MTKQAPKGASQQNRTAKNVAQFPQHCKVLSVCELSLSIEVGVSGLGNGSVLDFNAGLEPLAAMVTHPAMLFLLCAALLLPGYWCWANKSWEVLWRDDECAPHSDCSISARQLRGFRLLQRSGMLRWTNHPSKCLDVRDGQAKNGNRLQIWSCDSASPNQQFTWSSEDGKIRWAAHPGYCVDVTDHRNVNGNRLQLWECIATNSDQSFSIPASGQGPIQWANHPDKCMDVRDHGDWNGNDFQIWSCGADNSDQQFEFEGSGPSPTEKPEPPEEFDVIVIGGGLMGSAVAARLAAKLPQSRVVLLEAGRASHASLGGTEPPASWEPAQGRWLTWPLDQGGTRVTRYDVPGNYEVLQCWDRRCPESWERDVPYFQCKVLGGCGVMNGALVQRPLSANMETWPVGWRMSDLKRYYVEAEAMFQITPTPSRDGRHYLDNTGADFARSALEKAGFAKSDDLTKKAGSMCIPAVAAKDGLRQSTTSQLLPEALKRGNFKLQLETQVTEILHEAGVATGVRVTSAGGSKVLRLRSNGLLVVAAGALNTPRLLLQSGLHAEHQLGKDLSDHTMISLQYRVNDRSAFGANESFNLKPPSPNAMLQFVEKRSGPLAQYGPTLTAFLRDPTTSGPSDAYDVEIWVNSISRPAEIHVSLALMRPTCSQANAYLAGSTLHLQGQLYLGCQRDRQTMEFALDRVDKWLEGQGAKRFGKSPPEALHHFVGSCALGQCVDPVTLRLKGTSNVAVADASILPGQVWGHPFLTLSAVALKAADHLVSSFV